MSVNVHKTPDGRFRCPRLSCRNTYRRDNPSAYIRHVSTCCPPALPNPDALAGWVVKPEGMNSLPLPEYAPYHTLPCQGVKKVTSGTFVRIETDRTDRRKCAECAALEEDDEP